MVPPMLWVLLFFFIAFISFLISPRMYMAMHSWTRETKPERIYERMHGIAYLTNYRPFMATLSFRMRHFYGKWALISVLWSSIFTFWFAEVLLAPIEYRQAVCFSTFLIWIVLPPFLIWGTAKYMFKKYREERRGKRY